MILNGVDKGNLPGVKLAEIPKTVFTVGAMAATLSRLIRASSDQTECLAVKIEYNRMENSLR